MHALLPKLDSKAAFGATLFATLAATTSAYAKRPTPEYPSVVAAFSEVCLANSVDHAAKIAAADADPDWTEDDSVSVNIPNLGISKTISNNYNFSKVASSRQWSGTIDGQPAKLVTASFEGKVRYPHLCAIVMTGASNAMPYARELEDAFRKFGIKPKSVDLVHYYEYSGKLKPGTHPVDKKHPARGEIFTRSQAGSQKDTMHIYVAY